MLNSQHPTQLAGQQELDSVNVRLHGVALIEAAAGTGKTYNIQNLAARMIVEEGIPIQSLVIVTFTEKAAAELAERLRKILENLLIVARNEDLSDSKEQQRTEVLIKAMLSSGKLAGMEQLRERLQAALRDFDAKWVSTIHGFCARVLAENAFEGSVAFRVRLEQNITAYQEKLLQDFCRIHRYCAEPLPGAETLDAASLLDDVSRMMRVGGVHLCSRRKLFSSKEELLGELHRVMVEIKSYGRITELLEPLYGRLKKIGSLTGDDYLTTAAAEFEQFCADADSEFVHWYGLLKNLTPGFLIEKTSQKRDNKAVVQDHVLKNSFFALAERFCELYSIDSPLFLKMAAREYVCTELAKWKERDNFQDFDDLIIKMDQALDDERFRSVLQKKFQAAVIDEFQDTDPVQYAVFQKLFIRRPDKMFFMVGDPRQAIYSFRGGDLATYLGARQECLANGGEVFSLSTNYRSSGKLIEAFNKFFAHRDFFASPDITMNQIMIPTDYPPGIRQNGVELDRVLQISRDPEAGTGTLFRECAVNIVDMLNSQHYYLPDKNGKYRLLAPGDIAVLASSNWHLDEIRRELEKLGVPVIGERKSGIWCSPEAQELAVFLQAVLDNGNDSRIRLAMLTRLGNVPMQNMDMTQEKAADMLGQWRLEFRNFENCLRQVGIAGMMQMVYKSCDVKRTLSCQIGGERALANFTQLGDLLGNAERSSRLSPRGVLKFLQDKIARGAADDQSAEMLESDRSAVKLMTIHASKGLQFPVVFLPHLGANFPHRRDELRVYHWQNRLCCNLDDRLPEAQSRSALEELQELMRLLYVAVTRARMFCFISWGKVEKNKKLIKTTALDWLFGLKEYSGEWPESEAMALSFLGYNDLALELDETIPEELQFVPPEGGASGAVYQLTDICAPEELIAPQVQEGVRNNFRLISYSSLPLENQSAGAAAQAELQAPQEQSGWDDVEYKEEDDIVKTEDLTGGIWDLPGSNALGNVWHSYLERIDFTQPLPEKRLAEAMRAAGFTREEHHAAALEMFQSLMLRKLPCGMALHTLPWSRRVNEFEFMLNTPQGFSMRQLCAAVDDYMLAEFGAVYPGAKDFALSQGMFNGFIDMIFEYQGKFYIVDWKSNKLNCRRASFTEPQELKNAMLKGNYPMQYLCYLAALVRFLEQRLDLHFDEVLYERYVGDVYYIFLRGLCLPETHSGIFSTHVPFEVVRKLSDVISVAPSVNNGAENHA